MLFFGCIKSPVITSGEVMVNFQARIKAKNATADAWWKERRRDTIHQPHPPPSRPHGIATVEGKKRRTSAALWVLANDVVLVGPLLLAPVRLGTQQLARRAGDDLRGRKRGRVGGECENAKEHWKADGNVKRLHPPPPLPFARNPRYLAGSKGLENLEVHKPLGKVVAKHRPLRQTLDDSARDVAPLRLLPLVIRVLRQAPRAPRRKLRGWGWWGIVGVKVWCCGIGQVLVVRRMEK